MITEDRKKHIYAVAELMQKYAIDNNFSQEMQNELFALGLLHDIGYAFLEKQDFGLHEKIGGEFLKSQGYKFWKEVYYHGVVNSPYVSKELDILNWADMHIDGVGKFVSFNERLEDISKRHNLPINELTSKKLVEELKQKGFN